MEEKIMYKNEVDKKRVPNRLPDDFVPPTVPDDKIRITNERRRRNAKLRLMREKQQEGPKDLDDMLKLADVPRRKQPYLEYSEMREEERTTTTSKQSQEVLQFFKKILTYCEGNGMKASFKVVGDNLTEEFNKFTEKQLFEVQKLLDFAHDPINNDPKRRYIVSIPEHKIMNRIRNECKNRIPGFDIRVALSRLDEEKTDIENKREDFERRLKEEQRKFEEKQEYKKKLSEPTPTPTPIDDGFKKCKCGATLKRINDQHLNSKRHLQWEEQEKLKELKKQKELEELEKLKKEGKQN